MNRFIIKRVVFIAAKYQSDSQETFCISVCAPFGLMPLWPPFVFAARCGARSPRATEASRCTNLQRMLHCV